MNTQTPVAEPTSRIRESDPEPHGHSWIRPSRDPFIRQAQQVAADAHMGQRYTTAVPYLHHLDRTAGIARWAGLGPAGVAAAYLHDTLEDTRVTEEALAAEFGPRVASLVRRVTDGAGRTRTIRKATLYRKVRGRPAAAALKTADRLAHLEFIEEALAGDQRCYRDLGTMARARLYLEEHSEFEERILQYVNIDRLRTRYREAVAAVRERLATRQ